MRESRLCVVRQEVSVALQRHFLHQQVFFIDVLDSVVPLLPKGSVALEQHMDPNWLVQIVLIRILLYHFLYFFLGNRLLYSFRPFLLFCNQVLMLLKHLLCLMEFNQDLLL